MYFTLRCLYIKDCYIFLESWPFYYYAICLFILGIFLALKSVLSEINIAIPAFFGLVWAHKISNAWFQYGKRGFLHIQTIVGHQQSVPQFNSIKMLSIQRWHQIPEVKDSVPNLRCQLANSGYQLSFCWTSYRSELQTAPSLGLINWLRLLTELKKHLLSRSLGYCKWI